MNAPRTDGRWWWLLTSRRFKSFKFFAVLAVVLNVLLFVSLAWKSMLRSPSTDVQLDDDDFLLGLEVHADLRLEKPVQNVIRKISPEDINQNELKSDNELSSSNGAEGDVHKIACRYRTAVYLHDKHIELNQQPFAEHVSKMECFGGGSIAVFDNKYVRFTNALIDSKKIISLRKGGEKIEEVWNQREDDEYFKLEPGFFKASCVYKPDFRFLNLDHLVGWGKALECYQPNITDLRDYNKVPGTTLAIQRYEYVNLYHTMTDFYNAFVLMLIFGVPPSKFNILAVDAHPEGTLDPVWSVLFGKFIRAGRMPKPTMFENLVWGFLGYFSPLNEHDRTSVPYLEEFRDFFLSRHNISRTHVINCSKLNVLFIWRHNYVAHPRNPQGSVVRKFDNEDEMVQEVKDTLGDGASVQGLQLDTMPMNDQLEVVAKTDILIGMHGAGLSHILFLPQTSGVIEFKPEYSNPALLHFKAMADWRHLPYTIWHNFDAVNERADHKTYIPKSVMRKTIIEICSHICPKR